MRWLPFLLVALVLWPQVSKAIDPIPRRLPKAGKPIDDAQKEQWKAVLEKVDLPVKHDLGPDIEIYLKAVDLAMEFGEFYKEGDTQKGLWALKTATERLLELKNEEQSWTKQRGLVVRGYRSSIDQSAQPYGLEIPEALKLDGDPVPLYVWLHGRGDAVTDLHFIEQRSKKHWQFKGLLDDGIVLHPFGRQCIGFKSAGEIDVLEAVDHVIANYNVDPKRVVLMGYSMGGAGAWHLGAHYTERWAVVHAGAGFVDVKRYQKLGPDRMPSAMEQTLWGVYDVPMYARNFFNVPVIAYSGETDKQKDAADYMEEILKSYREKLPHVVGEGMGHKYDDTSRQEVAKFIKRSLLKPKDLNPRGINWQTRTLRYNKYAWIEVTGLKQHWQDTRVDGAFAARNYLRLTTQNVTSLTINRSLPEGCRIHIDGTSLQVKEAVPRVHLQRVGKTWLLADKPQEGLRKSPGLQGPIDDAFLAPFLVVAPTGKSKNAKLDEWVQFELAHLQSRWRALFRGNIRVIKDTDLIPLHAQKYNLVLFGTPESNKAIAKVLEQTPLKWPSEANRVLLGIYPNPDSPKRYVVLNSGPTFREGHDRTNSLQNPKLGDWAIIDLSEPPGPERPGKIIETGFFNESWQFPAEAR